MSDIDLRLGQWQDVLSDIEECDAVICDPPYSERTAKGQRGCRTSSWLGSAKHSGITYGFLTQDDVREVASHWAPLTKRWFVMFGDHITVRWALEALSDLGWYTFAPCVWTKTDAAPRILCDGPSPTVERIAVARPRRVMDTAEKRHRRSHYNGPSRNDSIVMGGKPSWLMRALVRDYSEPGDLVIDPFAGGASTALAARLEGRRCITSEADPKTHAKAAKRLAQGYTPVFDFGASA